MESAPSPPWSDSARRSASKSPPTQHLPGERRLGFGREAKQVMGIVTQRRNPPTSGAGATGGVVAGDPGGSDVGSTVMSGSVDIDSLLIVVMMDATNVEDDMLQDQLTEMQQMTDQKSQMRAIDDQMKQSEAALSGQMQTEFARGRLPATSRRPSPSTSTRRGAIASTRMSTTRPILMAATIFHGPRSATQEPCPPIPDWMHTGDRRPPLRPPPPTRKRHERLTSDLSATYGLPPQAEAMLRKNLQLDGPCERKPRCRRFQRLRGELGFCASVERAGYYRQLASGQRCDLGSERGVTDAQNASKDSTTSAYQTDLAAYTLAGVIQQQVFQNANRAVRRNRVRMRSEFHSSRHDMPSRIRVAIRQSVWRCGLWLAGPGVHDHDRRSAIRYDPDSASGDR